ncbi:extracellular solute-binding protein [Oceanobacter mangrovi]|uniref:extracellular solute-binding protein n=1 Tax=Oceanobacter mangrovi TaxID=2862510 RepID=UPI001C8D86E3|nr:extracellular solute-binding protein [Oceanobacter mangrovi]
MRKLLLLLSAIISSSVLADPATLKILNWGNYISPEVLAEFEQQQNVKVEYVEFNNEEEFKFMLFDDNSDFDVVFPSSRIINQLSSRQIIQQLDVSRLPALADIRPEIRSQFQRHDVRGDYGVPYMWGTTGLGINTRLLAQQGLGEKDYSLKLFDETTRQQAAHCGIALLYERDEIFAAALKYMGASVNTEDRAVLSRAGALVGAALKDVSYLHSTQYLDDLAAGNVCVTLGYSGDILGAIEGHDELAYIIPPEGAAMWIDVMAIPARARNLELAYQFINFLMKPETAAQNSNYLDYPTVMNSSLPLINPDVLNNPGIYPPLQLQASLETLSPVGTTANKRMNKEWVKSVCASGKYCTVPVSAYF